MSNKKFEFRRGKSTPYAIQFVIQTAELAIGHERSNILYYADVTLDVRNAFNSTS